MSGVTAPLALITAAVLAVNPVLAAEPRVPTGAAVEVCPPGGGATARELGPEDITGLVQAVRELITALLRSVVDGGTPGGGRGSGAGADDGAPSSGTAPEDGALGPIVVICSPGERNAEPAPPSGRGRGSTGEDRSGDAGGGAGDTEDDDQGADTGAAAGSPGELLDLQDWYLTLPTGSEGEPEDVQQPDLQTYSSEYFRMNDDGDGVVFRANAGGVTTENSEYPRSELREMTGGEHAAWSNTTGTHTLEVREAITEVPPAKPEVVAAQIHGGDDDVLQIRLEGSTLAAQYADGQEQTVLDPGYQLGTPYDLRIVAAEGRITVFYDGQRKAEIEASGSGWYWKVGAYTQSNPDQGDDADAAGEVVLYSLQIEHTDAQ